MKRKDTALSGTFLPFLRNKSENVWWKTTKTLPLHHKNPPSLSTMLKSAGRFMLTPMEYTKQYSNPAQLVELLKERGLEIANDNEAESFIRAVGYYRLSAYLYPFLSIPKQAHIFKYYCPLNVFKPLF